MLQSFEIWEFDFCSVLSVHSPNYLLAVEDRILIPKGAAPFENDSDRARSELPYLSLGWSDWGRYEHGDVFCHHAARSHIDIWVAPLQWTSQSPLSIRQVHSAMTVFGYPESTQLNSDRSSPTIAHRLNNRHGGGSERHDTPGVLPHDSDCGRDYKFALSL